MDINIVQAGMLLGVLLTAYYTGRMAHMKYLERRETKPTIVRMQKLDNTIQLTVVNNRPHNIALLDVYAKRASRWLGGKRIKLNWEPPRKIPEGKTHLARNPFFSVMVAEPVYVVTAESTLKITLPDDLEETTYKIVVKTSVGTCEATYQHRPHEKTTTCRPVFGGTR